MKKIFLLVLVGVFLISSVSAISTTLEESYEAGETIIVEIEGNILDPIAPEDIELRRDHVLVPLDYDVKRLGDRYFIWLSAPSEENEYRLLINDVLTTEAGKNVEVDFEQNFSVVGNLTDYSVKPGLIFAKEDFSFSVQLNTDVDLEIDVGEEVVVLEPGINTIDFSVDDFRGAQLNFITIGKYEVPAYVIGTRSGTVFNGTSVIDAPNVSDDEEEEVVEEDSGIDFECNELSNGDVCSAGQLCDGEIVQALDGNCCVGSCVVPSEGDGGGNGAFVGVIIVFIVLIVGIFLWARYRKAKPKKSALDKAKDATGTP